MSITDSKKYPTDIINQKKLYAILQHSVDYLFNFDLSTNTMRDDSAILGHEDSLPTVSNIPEGLVRSGLLKASGQKSMQKMIDNVKRGVSFVSCHVEFRRNTAEEFKWYSFSLYSYKESKDGDSIIAGFIKSIHTEIMQRKNLELLAEYDELTQIHNRRSGKQLVEEILALPRSGEEDHTMFIFDLDNFKNINDVYGHYTGDTVLRGFAKLLTRIFRRTDIVYRLGGDEFIVFAPNAGSDYFLRRICRDVITLSSKMEDIDFPVSVSIGAAISSNPSASYDDYYKAADQALYSIKNNKKGDFAFSYF